eukprot:25280-Eustigmatos_ZCMA.PRE.1
MAHINYGPTASNGKSVLAYFMALLLGQYYKDVAIAWFCTRNRTQVNSADSVAHSMKGRRYINLNEGDTSDVIDSGTA